MRFIFTFIFLFLAATCGAETAKFVGVVPIKPPQTPANSSVSITVNGTGAAALLYADNGTTRITNPIRADAYGAYQFETAVGVYDITMTRADGTTSTWTKVTIGLDPTAVPWSTPGTIGSTTPNTIACTTLSATGQITSTLATGSAPLVIASTTLVPNLYVARSALADVGTTVTTNHNMTGPITGTGNVTSVTAQTGTGTTFVMDTSPTLVTPALGTATATAITSGNLTDSALTSGRITTAGTAGLLQDFAGLSVVGTPSATAPSTGTNGPGLTSGLILQGADGVSHRVVLAEFMNGAATQHSITCYSCEGTAASPGATITNDGFSLVLKGHDGTNFTGNKAAVVLNANGTWSPTSTPTRIYFQTTPSASTTLTNAWNVDSNQILATGANAGCTTFTGGTLAPKLQCLGTGGNTAGFAQTQWSNNGTAPFLFMGKSRSATVNTQSVITTGDTLGQISWQGDDGTNFVAAAQLVALSEGTIGAGQIPGRLRAQTATSGGTMTTGYSMDSQQVSIFGNVATALGSVLYTGGTVTPRVQVMGTSATTSSSAALGLAMFANNTSGGSLYFAKSRSGTIGTMTTATTGDTLGNIDFQASDGTNFNSAAKIIATTTGTLAGSRTPGQLVFQTGVDAAGSALTTGMTITNAQVVQENGTTEASAVGTANVVNSGGLSVAKRSFLGTIGSTFKGDVIAGVQDGTAVAAGQVGEVLTGAQSSPTNFTTTATIQQLASISLTDGDWLETATMTLAMNGATEVAAAEAICYLDDTTASATGAVEGETIGYIYEPASGSSVHATVTIVYHESISAAKTKYLNGQATWTAGQPKYTCSMKAVRIR